MFKKVLIANRGEIAIRIIRACKELGIKTVAVYSEGDKDSLHVQLADEAVCIGPTSAQDSYLNIPNIIAAAEITHSDAIHPGYGFLAENAQFAEICSLYNITFIGPPKEAISLAGDKVKAKEMARKANIPVIPGSEGPVSLDDPNLEKLVERIGYPVIIKARAGGGGKGMRLVLNEENLRTAMATAQAEAKASFNNPEIYIEKYIEQPRHIEIQIVADKKGNIVYFPERECSIQRRHQKLIEESPSVAINAQLRQRIGRAAVKFASYIGYHNVGTVEFLLDSKGQFYFMEMNTRIQVEHTVTECVTGHDLVKEQILLAAGEKINYTQNDINILHTAIEARINAEDAARDFSPSPGMIKKVILPSGPGIRVDTHIYQNYVVPPYYDSLIAKVIAFDLNRKNCIAKLRRALSEFIIEGIKTTIPFHLKILEDEYFLEGKTYTNFIQERIYGKKA